MGAERAQPSLRLYLDVQRASQSSTLPSDTQLRHWARAALTDLGGTHELTLRLVDESESAELNAGYRHKNGPTNVLSFPFEAPPGAASRLLGDLIICAPVVEREAREQGKDVLAHWAHMVAHGILHLRGYDHLTDAEATDMEALETTILARLGYVDPYSPGSRC
ncbi:MAG: rRNA maturation RNase YbeY [Gammaproteobacteria bacterium]|nr:rRNA maturation RNase YbeY [Gammaproteobacteria bacterium]